jgi:hypothetical protein
MSDAAGRDGTPAEYKQKYIFQRFVTDINVGHKYTATEMG